MQTEKELLKLAEKHGWGWISQYQNLSEKFIEKHKDYVDWYWIPRKQNLSEKFIEKHKNKVDWYWISQYQNLSEKFIEKHKNKVNWEYISACQILSEEFIEKHKDKVNINVYKIIHKRASNNTIKKLLTKFKIEKDKNGEYVVGYKVVNFNLCSYAMPWFKYEIGKVAEDWHCNCDLDVDSSFGLSCFNTIEKTKEYQTKGRVLKVKVYLKDIGAVVQNGEKIRCWKQTIIEEVK